MEEGGGGGAEEHRVRRGALTRPSSRKRHSPLERANTHREKECIREGAEICGQTHTHTHTHTQGAREEVEGFAAADPYAQVGGR